MFIAVTEYNSRFVHSVDKLWSLLVLSVVLLTIIGIATSLMSSMDVA